MLCAMRLSIHFCILSVERIWECRGNVNTSQKLVHVKEAQKVKYTAKCNSRTNCLQDELQDFFFAKCKTQIQKDCLALGHNPKFPAPK